MKTIKRKIELEFTPTESETIRNMIYLVQDVISNDEDFEMCNGFSCEGCPLRLFCESTDAEVFGENLVRIVEENKY